LAFNVVFPSWFLKPFQGCFQRSSVNFPAYK
jgi:hypothetical protein